MNAIDKVVLHFDASSLFILNIVLAFIMFGVALDLKWINFKSVFRSPRSLFIGLASQLLMLPFLSFLLIIILKPMPSMALGMILVASCPGGNISNFISKIAGANVELSIVMTVISSLAAVVLTPLNLSIYGNLYEPTRSIMREVHLDWLEITRTIAMIIIVPIIVGRLFDIYYPGLSNKIKQPFKNISMLAFLVIIILALIANGAFFKRFIGSVFLLVFAHNAVAYLSAYILGKSFSLNVQDLKSISIETGIQNSGLGLLLIFAFFSGLGGMAVITAWWGIWHIIAGFAFAYFVKNRWSAKAVL